MIYKKLLIAACVAASALAGVATTQAQHLSIELGDRPYYTHGPYYHYNGYRMVWVPGHWGHHHRWIHGQYVRRERWNGHGVWHSGYSRY
jgi:hypothetical protein